MKLLDNEENKSVGSFYSERRSSRQDVWAENDVGTDTVNRMTDREHDDAWILKQSFRKTWILKQSIYKTKDIYGADVCVSRKHNSSLITVTVKAASILDLRAVFLMNRVDEFVRRYKAENVIIDLARTHFIPDSGLAMLLLLKKKLGQKIKKIKLINTRHLQHSHFGCLDNAFEIM